jgi:hypothetical protein
VHKGERAVPSMIEDMLEVPDHKDNLDKIFEEFLKPENIKHNTQLSDKEIKTLMVLGPLAEKWDLDLMKRGIMELYTLRVSAKRGGRTEWVRILQSFAEPEVGQEMGGGRFGRWFRRRDGGER